jgi:hypothetical protein
MIDELHHKTFKTETLRQNLRDLMMQRRKKTESVWKTNLIYKLYRLKIKLVLQNHWWAKMLEIWENLGNSHSNKGCSQIYCKNPPYYKNKWLLFSISIQLSTLKIIILIHKTKMTIPWLRKIWWVKLIHFRIGAQERPIKWISF